MHLKYMEKSFKVTNDWNLIDMADILHRSVMIKSGKLYSSCVAIDIPVHPRILEEEEEYDDNHQSMPDDELSSIGDEKKSASDEDLCRCECESDSSENKLYSFFSEDICLIDDATVTDNSNNNNTLLSAASHDSLELLAKSYEDSLSGRVMDEVSDNLMNNQTRKLSESDSSEEHHSIEDVFMSSRSSSSASLNEGFSRDDGKEKKIEVYI